MAAKLRHPSLRTGFFLSLLISCVLVCSAAASRQQEGEQRRRGLRGQQDGDQPRGALRERIRERLKERAGETRETRRRNERRPDETTEIAGLSVAVWEPPQRGRVPLIVFSHGLNGCNVQSSFLMQQIADAGYLVVAPNHKDATCGGGGRPSRPEERLGRPGSWSDNTYRDRADDIRRLLAALHRDQLNPRIEWSRVGLIGHSLGGYTVLGLAGAWPNWRLADVKAVVAWSPYCEPFVAHGDLSGIRVPVMYQGGTRDLGITPSIRKNGGCFAKMGPRSIFVEFQGAGHFAWSDLQDRAQDLISDYTIEFLDKYLQGSSRANPGQRVAGVADLRVK